MHLSQSTPTQHLDCVIEERAAEYRRRFVRAVAHLGLDADGARRVAEAVSGHSFDACGPDELEPLLLELQGIARQLASERRPPCPA